MAESGSMYHAAGLRGPELEDLRELNAEMKFMCPDQQLQEMAEVMKEMTKAYQRVSEMIDTTVPRVKYPRTPGYRPLPEDNPYNAWAWRCDIQGAPTGKLAGKTVAIKDNTAVAGIPMRNGCKFFENYMPEFDATVVTRILDAGGRILGKAGVEDMCFSGSSITNSDGPIRNPADERCTAGGSSSGSGALVCVWLIDNNGTELHRTRAVPYVLHPNLPAMIWRTPFLRKALYADKVASGQVDMAIGGDQGGSIRIPSSYTGIVGLKPTWGLVPYTGAASIEPTVDHLGPMAKTVADCALMLEVIAGYDDGRDHRQIPSVLVPEYSKLIEQGVDGKKIGLLKEGFEVSSQTVSKVVTDAANSLVQAGCIIKEVSIPMHKDGAAIWTVSAGHAAFKCMVESNVTGYFTKGFYPTSMQEAMFRGYNAYPQDAQPLLKYFSLYMKYIDRLYGNRFYGKSQNLVYELSRRYDAALQEFDVLVLPTLPEPAARIPSADLSFEELVKNCLSMTPNTMPFNITGHPALSVNAGFSAPDAERGALPIGLMIVGKKFDEVTVLQVARAVEKLTL